MTDRKCRQVGSPSSAAAASLASAWMPVVELLEPRRLFATTTIQPLPFTLDFGSDRGELLDKDGQGTGFTRVQANRLGNAYQAGLIDLDSSAGVLRITTTGTATAGSNSGGDNTLVNALETQFNATTSGFSISARLVGPLGFINNPSEQAGIMFGPDQDNWVKLVAVSQPVGQRIQFIDEQTTSGVYSSALAGSNVANTYTDVGSFSSINTLDLRLVGDAVTGKVQAWYAVNGGAYVKIGQELALSGAKKDAFFNSAGRAGLIALHKNDVGPITATFDKFEILGGTAAAARPSISATRPANGATGVRRDAFVAADVTLTTAGAGVDTATLSASTVKLYRTSDGALVTAVLNTSGGGDAIVLTPADLLAASTNYTFEVTSGLKDTSGNAFLPFTMSFTTGTAGGETDGSLAFEKLTLSNATGRKYSSVKMGPDGKLYATTIDGLIQRFTLNSNGTVASVQNITSLQTLEGGQTFLTSIVFDPASTASNVIIWATHSQYAFENATDWTGKISRITGANLETAVNKVVSLPRSIRDHVTNQAVFGPDGALYFAQGSMSAMGAPDNAWGLRAEHLLNAAILRLDTSRLPSSGALNVKTDSGGTYNPYAAGAALTIYATGVRNAYDLVWTRDGRLYAATNGSAAGGNTPAGDGAPALTNVQQTQNDYLFLVEQGGYYGHPNPTRGEYVLNGGNPTSGVDPGEVTAYPIGTMPDSNWRGFVYDFGKNYSPNGTIQYSGGIFDGALDGRLMIARYSGGDDILVLTLGADGKVIKTTSGISGFTHFVDPLDLVQNTATGFLYVAEYGGERLTLVRPVVAGANIQVDKQQLYFNDPVTTGSSTTQTITIRNTGTGSLSFPSDGFTMTGADGARFTITAKPATPLSIAPGESVTVSVRFTSSSTIRIYTAKLAIKSNDPDSPLIEVDLRGLGTAGTGGQNEPSLQRLLDLFQIPINVGDANADNTNLFSSLEPLLAGNDELTVQRLVKAGAGPVTIEPIAVMGVSGSPAVKFGYYRAGTPDAKTELFTIASADAQSVNPTAIGTTSFDPGSAAFGIYSMWPWPTFKNPDNSARAIYSEDSLNRFENVISDRRKIRFYALRDESGTIVPNAYVMAHEEYINDTGGAYDNQDIVAIIRNVRIAPEAPVLGLEKRDGGGVPFPDRLVFNRIDNPDELFPNVVHDLATLRINNTGNQPLSISSMSVSGPFALVGSYSYPVTIAAGSYLDVQIRFTLTAAGLPSGTLDAVRNGTFTINSNDPSRPATTIQLSGQWQSHSERTPHPGAKPTESTLAELISVFGYSTSIPSQSVLTSTGNGSTRLNDEILSGYWMRAEASMPVKITQLAAFHTQGNTERLATHLRGSTSLSTVFTHAAADGQSILPHLSGSSTALAAGTVSTSHAAGVFGFRSGDQWSDDALNPQNTPGGGGRFLRIFPAKDRSGNVIPNTYLIAHDYYSTDPTTGANTSNFDFQDNIYLVENVRPASDSTAPAVPAGLTASGAADGVALDWANNTESDLAGYNVYRSTSATGTFTKLNSSLLSSSAYLDTTAPQGSTSYYRVVAVDSSGNASVAATTSATRPPGDSTAPAAPAGQTATTTSSGIALDWVDNIEADLAGYNVYRGSSPTGTFTKLNTAGLLTASSFLDTSAPNGTSYYRITAVDTSGNESATAAVSGSRQLTYSGVDVNGSTPAGSMATLVEGLDYDISGGGANIGGSSDSFYYAYRQLSGDFDMRVRVDGLTKVDNLTRAGIMARESLTGESRNAFVYATPSAYADRFSYRGETGGSTTTVVGDGKAVTYPNNWLRLRREGSKFTAYKSTDGTNWTLIGSGTVNVPQTVFFGLAVSSRSTTKLATANFRAFTSLNTEVPPPPDTTAPNTPSSLVASGNTSGVTLDWANNTESDLAGYNVYRASSSGGTYVKLNTSMLTGSSYVDTTATAGVVSYYRVTAIDASGNESAAATASATRLATSVPSGPIRINFQSNGSPTVAGYDQDNGDVFGNRSNGMQYGWNIDHTELDRDRNINSNQLLDTLVHLKAGVNWQIALTNGTYDVKVAVGDARYATPHTINVNGINYWTNVTTAANQFLIKTMRVTVTDGRLVIDNGASDQHDTRINYLEILPATETPAVQTLGRINFQAKGSPAVSGYDQDHGDVFGVRSNGMEYGWNIDHTHLARDRNMNSNQLLDTLVHLKAGVNWQMALANGWYDVKVSVGDSRYTTPHTINVNGINYWNNVTTAANQFLTKTMRVNVTNGRLKIDNGASDEHDTRINYVEIVPVMRINFQANGSPTVAGYEQDNGDVFGSRANGMEYGWNIDHTELDRDRNMNSNQLLDTLVHLKAAANWQIALPNGKYEVKVAVGDARYSTPHTINVNGVNYWNNVTTAANQFLNKTMTITVANGRLTIDNGASDQHDTRINYLELRQIG